MKRKKFGAIKRVNRTPWQRMKWRKNVVIESEGDQFTGRRRRFFKLK